MPPASAFWLVSYPFALAPYPLPHFPKNAYRDFSNFQNAQILEVSQSVATQCFITCDDILGQSSGGNTSWLLYDGHDSTRALADSAGALTARYSYDAYGCMLGGDPTLSRPADTDLLYSGEQFDPGLQQQYLRARYYDQKVGGFASLDPFAGNNSDPQSLHKYAYCHGDGVNGVDPSGLFSLVEVVIVAAVMLFLGTSTAQAAEKVSKRIHLVAVLIGGPMSRDYYRGVVRRQHPNWTNAQVGAEANTQYQADRNAFASIQSHINMPPGTLHGFTDAVDEAQKRKVKLVWARDQLKSKDQLADTIAHGNFDSVVVVAHGTLDIDPTDSAIFTVATGDTQINVTDILSNPIERPKRIFFNSCFAQEFTIAAPWLTTRRPDRSVVRGAPAELGDGLVWIENEMRLSVASFLKAEVGRIAAGR